MSTSLLYPGINHFCEMNCVFGIAPDGDAKEFYGKVAKILRQGDSKLTRIE